METYWYFLGIPLVLLIGFLVVAFIRRKAFLTFEDVLSTPDREVSVRLQLEERLFPFIDPVLPGRKVRITVEGKETEHETSDVGRIEIAQKVKTPAVIPLRAEMPSGLAADAAIHVVPADRPLFVCDIDETISDMSNLMQAMTPVGGIPAIGGSREALERIAKMFQVVYLSARDHIYMAKTREWLKGNNFPPGPLFLRRLRYWQARPQEHKEIRLEEILKPFSGPRVGVGDKMTDVRAYIARDVKAIYYGKTKPADLPEEARHAQDWMEVEKFAKEWLRTS